MVLKSTTAGNVSVYQVAGTNVSRSLPDWIAKKRKQALKKDLEYQTRIELIQDFEFSEASNKIRVTRDGQFAMATGTYKPQIHVYDFANLSLKFDRHTDCENVDFCILSDDWTKSVHLQNDRSIEFQTKGGIHYRTRIPKFGRSLSYNDRNCDLLVAASGNEMYRLNLEQGRFLAPYQLETESGANTVDINSVHGLICAGLEDGTVEFWDPRSRQRAAKLFVGTQLGESVSVTATAYREDGLTFACGTSSGKSLLYDLRSSVPSIVKDQGYGFAIKKVSFVDNKVLTADKRIVKLWEREDGKPFAAMEPSVDINDVEHIPGSGMFFIANDGMPMHTYYIPNLGPAPQWCSFLDNVTEELEEKPSETVFSNYRFITRDEVRKLNLGHLVGTKVLHSYMHGFFIDNELYDKVNLIANPDSYRDQREREIRNRIEKERESRIRSTGAVTNTKIKVNKDLASKLEGAAGTASAESVVNDDRFKEMFENPDFAIDEQSHDYKQIYSVKPQKDITKERGLTAVEEEQQSNESSEESESEEEQVSPDKVKKELERVRRRKEEAEKANKFMNDMKAVSAEGKSESFGARLKKVKVNKSDGRMRRHARGEVELTFVPKSEKKEKEKREREGGEKGRTKQRFEGRRIASRNKFRGM